MKFLDSGRPRQISQGAQPLAMLKYLRGKPVDLIIVHEMDHLARNCDDDATKTDRIRATEARLVSVTKATNTKLRSALSSTADFYFHDLAIAAPKGLRQKSPCKSARAGARSELRLVEGSEIRHC